jgi:hypothetical protein
MTTLRGIAQPSDYRLSHTLLAYWRSLLVLCKAIFGSENKLNNQSESLSCSVLHHKVRTWGRYSGLIYSPSQGAKEGLLALLARRFCPVPSASIT